jgi:hypothetical protein
MKLFWETNNFHHNDRQYPFKHWSHTTRSLTSSSRSRRFEPCLDRCDCVGKFVSLHADSPNTLQNVSGFSLPPIKTDCHNITEKLLIMAKNDEQANKFMFKKLTICGKTFQSLKYLNYGIFFFVDIKSKKNLYRFVKCCLNTMVITLFL